MTPRRKRKAPAELHHAAVLAVPDSQSAPIAAVATRKLTDVAARRRDVWRWLSRAASSALVVSRLMAKYRVSRRTAEGDLAAVRDRWLRAIEREEPARRTKLLGHLDEILRCAMADENWNAATRAAMTLAQICGFTKTNVSVELNPAQRQHLAALHLEPAHAVDKQRALIGALAMTPPQREQRRQQLLAQRALPAPRNGEAQHADYETQSNEHQNPDRSP